MTSSRKKEAQKEAIRKLEVSRTMLYSRRVSDTEVFFASVSAARRASSGTAVAGAETVENSVVPLVSSTRVRYILPGKPSLTSVRGHHLLRPTRHHRRFLSLGAEQKQEAVSEGIDYMSLGMFCSIMQHYSVIMRSTLLRLTLLVSGLKLCG